MGEYTAKDIRVAPISSRDANRLIKRLHYSGKVVNNSQLHLGVFLGDRLEGAMQFGPSMDKSKIRGLVTGTQWNGFIELNRMAFSERLPRNSESRALGVAFRLFKKHYHHIEWIVSFADGTQCGDGAMYRASGFVLTSIKRNNTIIKLEDGTIGANITYSKSHHILKTGAARSPKSSEVLCGYQFRYIYFIDKAARVRLTAPILPFSKIEEIGAGMYKGEKISRPKKHESGDQPESGRGSTDPDAPILNGG